jgi:DNA-binding transcriptional LysR family regulator
MDELYKIRAFLDVVDHGSFSAAARHAGVSVSSVARRIAALEDELGVRLLNRNTRRLSLTEAGTNFFQRTKEVIRELDSAKVEAQSFQTTITGLLRVSLRISVGMLVLPRVGEFLERHPGLVLDLSLTDERLDLLQNHIDVAVWIGQLSDSELIARLLSRGRRLVCASPDYLARHGEPSHPRELSDHLCMPHRAPNYDGTWRFTKGDERWDVCANGSFQSSSPLALMSAGMSGLGLVVLQYYMVASALKEGTLRAVLTDYEVSPTDADASIYAVYPHSRHLSPKARAFIDFLVDLFGEIDKNA